MHYCSLYDVRRQPRRHQGRIMRSRVKVQIGLSVRSSRACRKCFVRPLSRQREPVARASSDQERSNLRVIESRMMKPCVGIHAYSGLRRLVGLIASVLRTASSFFTPSTSEAQTRRARTAGHVLAALVTAANVERATATRRGRRSCSLHCTHC